jgi:hypothetical protein
LCCQGAAIVSIAGRAGRGNPTGIGYSKAASAMAIINVIIAFMSPYIRITDARSSAQVGLSLRPNMSRFSWLCRRARTVRATPGSVVRVFRQDRMRVLCLKPGPSIYARRTFTRSNADQVRSSVTAGSPTFRTRAWTVLPPTVPYGRPTISHSPVSSVKRSPALSCIGSTDSAGDAAGSSGFGFFGLLAIPALVEHGPDRALNDEALGTHLSTPARSIRSGADDELDSLTRRASLLADSVAGEPFESSNHGLHGF